MSLSILHRRRLLNVQPAPSDAFGVYHLDDGSGTTALDSSGNGRNIVANYTPNWVAGYKNGAIQGNDTNNNYFELDPVNTTNLFNNNDGFTLSFWYYSGGDNNYSFGCGANATTGNRLLRIGCEGASATWRILIGGSTGNWVKTDFTSINAVQGAWTHIAISIGHTQYKFYQNGVLVETSTAYDTGGSFKDTGIGLKIAGAEGYAMDSLWKKDEIYLYDRLLNDSEITELAAL